MTTTFVGMKEFRQNMAQISEEACRKNRRLVVLRKNKPIFSVVPLSRKEQLLEELVRDAAQAKVDYKAGRTFSLEQIEKELGLRA